jgi:hypothetical protein
MSVLSCFWGSFLFFDCFCFLSLVCFVFGVFVGCSCCFYSFFGCVVVLWYVNIPLLFLYLRIHFCFFLFVCIF